MTQLFPSIAGQNTLFEGKFETDMVNSGERLGLVQNIESISTKFSYPRTFEGYWWKKSKYVNGSKILRVSKGLSTIRLRI